MAAAGTTLGQLETAVMDEADDAGIVSDEVTVTEIEFVSEFPDIHELVEDQSDAVAWVGLQTADGINYTATVEYVDVVGPALDTAEIWERGFRVSKDGLYVSGNYELATDAINHFRGEVLDTLESIITDAGGDPESSEWFF